MDPIRECPWCHQVIWIEEIRCGIFRCGILKDTFQQVEPHLPKLDCDRLAAEGKIYGCGKPFQYKEGGLEKCDYI
jgi:hypothetical protein